MLFPCWVLINVQQNRTNAIKFVFLFVKDFNLLTVSIKKSNKPNKPNYFHFKYCGDLNALEKYLHLH